MGTLRKIVLFLLVLAPEDRKLLLGLLFDAVQPLQEVLNALFQVTLLEVKFEICEGSLPGTAVVSALYFQLVD